MPSQSALELRPEHWRAGARGGHDGDEAVTLLWQRAGEGQTIRPRQKNLWATSGSGNLPSP